MHALNDLLQRVSFAAFSSAAEIEFETECDRCWKMSHKKETMEWD